MGANSDCVNPQSCLIQDYPGRSQKEHGHDENRNDRPGKFNLRTTVYLGRLTTAIRRFATEFHDRVEQQTTDDYE